MSVQYYLVTVFSRLSKFLRPMGEDLLCKSGSDMAGGRHVRVRRSGIPTDCCLECFRREHGGCSRILNIKLVSVALESRAVWKDNVHCCSLVCMASRAGSLALTSKESNWFELENSKKKANPSLCL